MANQLCAMFSQTPCGFEKQNGRQVLNLLMQLCALMSTVSLEGSSGESV